MKYIHIADDRQVNWQSMIVKYNYIVTTKRGSPLIKPLFHCIRHGLIRGWLLYWLMAVSFYIMLGLKCFIACLSAHLQTYWFILQITGILEKSTVWRDYKDQKHDLFISDTPIAGYLTGKYWWGTSIKHSSPLAGYFTGKYWWGTSLKNS